jgi:AraC-like DNA-binding protein
MWDWQGQLDYRRRNLRLARGDTFMVDPGEMFHADPHDGRAGTFRVFEFSSDLLKSLCAAEGVMGPIHFAQIVAKATPQLAAALDMLQSTVLDDDEPLRHQSALAMMANAAVASTLEKQPRAPSLRSPHEPCERLREILHSSEGARLNLQEFARAAEVSQFQLLRAFKKRYGAPPHAYSVHLRVERARQLLRTGLSVADTAAATDFADQSHLTRHFLRIWGFTPGRYAANTSLVAYAPPRRAH